MINNKSCVSCQQPMNGGVYRKPNQCPHCLSVQDQAKSPDNKPLNALAAQIAPPSAAPARIAAETIVPIIAEKAPHTAKVIAFDKHLVEVEEWETEDHQNEDFAIEEVAFEATPSVPVLDEVIVDEVILDEEVVLASKQPLPPEDNVAEAATSRPKCFENLEVQPDLEESLDIALTIDVDDQWANEEAFSVDTSSFLSMEHAVVALARETHLRGNTGSAVRADVAPRVMAPVLSAPLPSMAPVLVERVKTKSTITEKKQPKPQAVESQSNGSDYEKVVLTTESAHAMQIEKHIDLVTAECVVGMDRVKNDMNKTREFSRKEYGASPSVLKEARKTVLDEIKKEAFLRGADTVVDVQLAYKEISSGDSPMMMVVATGTAVKAKEKQAVGA